MQAAKLCDLWNCCYLMAADPVSHIHRAVLKKKSGLYSLDQQSSIKLSSFSPEMTMMRGKERPFASIGLTNDSSYLDIWYNCFQN